MVKPASNWQHNAAHDGALGAYSIPGFCAAHSISRGMFFKLMSRGLGPKVMKLGRRTLITIEAATAWREMMQARIDGMKQDMNGV